MYATPVIRQALQVSASAHKVQVRKGSGIPYIVHPVGVMLTLAEFTSDEVTLAAALLHDALEDTAYTEAQMRRDFGDDVTNTVKAVTKDATITDWRARNENYLATLRTSGNDRAFMVSAADKINNLESTLADFEELGDDLWDRFHTGKDDQLWWYRSVLTLLEEKLPTSPLVIQLAKLVTQLEAL
ncbi:MAG: HD domain-containing protein [Candidatus Saccharimonadia bacterium]